MLQGKTSLITGGTAGIGRAIALCFAKDGANVVIIGTSEERGSKVLEEIKAISGSDKHSFCRVDVSSGEEIENAIKLVLENYGKIDVLVNNAGITRDALFMSMKEVDWDDVINVNLKSVYFTCHAVIRNMIKARAGKIINVSSVIGLVGNAGQTNYAASKAGMIGFTKSLAKEVAARNICVNCIAPGFIKTRMTDALTDKQKDEILKVIPMKRIGNPDDIANAALFLASDQSNYMTGQVLTIDGGMVM